MSSHDSQTRTVVIVAIVGVCVLCGLGGVMSVGGYFFYRAGEERVAAQATMAELEASRAAERRAWLESLPEGHGAAMQTFDAAERAALDLVRGVVAGDSWGLDADVETAIRDLASSHGGVAHMESPGGETTESREGTITQMEINVLIAWVDGELTTVRVTLDHGRRGRLTASAIEIADAVAESE